MNRGDGKIPKTTVAAANSTATAATSGAAPTVARLLGRTAELAADRSYIGV